MRGRLLRAVAQCDQLRMGRVDDVEHVPSAVCRCECLGISRLFRLPLYASGRSLRRPCAKFTLRRYQTTPSLSRVARSSDSVPFSVDYACCASVYCPATTHRMHGNRCSAMGSPSRTHLDPGDRQPARCAVMPGNGTVCSFSPPVSS